MIKYIKFEKPFLRRRFVAVALSSGNIYKLKMAGGLAYVVPPCNDSEREALGTVYKAVWEFLNGVDWKDGYTLDRGAKIACGRLVSLLDWPQNFTTDTQTRLDYVVNKITYSENIF